MSGWRDTAWSWYCDEQRDDTPALNLSEPLSVTGGVGYFDHQYPAYDLGYLMRKLGPGVEVRRALDRYYATRLDWYTAYGEDTPEDAMARLGIALLEAGARYVDTKRL